MAKSKMAAKIQDGSHLLIQISQPVFNRFGSKFACTTSRSGLTDIQNGQIQDGRQPIWIKICVHHQV